MARRVNFMLAMCVLVANDKEARKKMIVCTEERVVVVIGAIAKVCDGQAG